MPRTIGADRIQDALDLHGDGIRILSLDCFDTLVWRTTHAPSDVFADLPESSGPRVRVYSEEFERYFAKLSRGKTEVDLREIWGRILGSSGESGETFTEQVESAAQQELALEWKHCFGYRPTAELISRAKARGMGVIVVSDTYLKEPELRALIAQAAGQDVADAIDRIFCSCEFGLNKSAGLFSKVLPLLKVASDEVLHIGDNLQADHDAPARLGVRTLHLQQFDELALSQFRLEAMAASLFDPSLRHRRALRQLHRAPIALRGEGGSDLDHAGQDDPASRLGFRTLGPIMLGFASWVLEQCGRLASEQDSEVRPLFLLRDGHLPHQAFEAIGGGGFKSSRVELSRFTAFASSFSDERSVLEYLAEFGATGRFDALGRQLLFTRNERDQLEARIKHAGRPLEAFKTEVMRPTNLKKIMDRSSGFADRLVQYLRRHAGVENGQCLAFVDLGYAGTVQDRLAPVLADRMGVSVHGLYMLLRDVARWKQDKLGFIGPDRYDYRSLDSLCAYVAIVEQLSTIEQSSVVDYTQDGAPIRQSTDLKSRQSEIRQKAQAGCLTFVREHARAYAGKPSGFDIEGLRDTACGSLARLLFFPVRNEIELFRGFEHDVNMGVQDKVTLFDESASARGLIKRGLFYTNDNPRQFLPAEIRLAGMQTSLSMTVLRRFTNDLRWADFQTRGPDLPIMIDDSRTVAKTSTETWATHDGWSVANIPVGNGRLGVGVAFGEGCEWVQISSIALSRLDRMMKNGDADDSKELMASALHEDMEAHPNGLFRCSSSRAFLFVPPSPVKSDEPHVLSIVFRVIAPRATGRSSDQAPVSSAGAPSALPPTSLQ
jgi:FMN phosphatase YigB (HAD superfamily)